MIRMITRSILILAGVSAALVMIALYYNQTMEYLMRLEQLAHVAIPTALALGLLYSVVKNIVSRNK
jgi:hypothetical protein